MTNIGIKVNIIIIIKIIIIIIIIIIKTSYIFKWKKTVVWITKSFVLKRKK